MLTIFSASTPTSLNVPTATPINITNTGSGSSTRSIPSSSSATTSALPSGTAAIKAECPGVDKTNLTAATGQQFYRECEINYATNDLQTQFATTMADCINTCVSWNSKTAQLSPCTGVVWTYGGQDAGNCWLKSKMLNRGVVPTGTESAMLLV